MASKRNLRERIRTLELEQVIGPEPLTFRTLTICFSERTVELDGRRIRIDYDCLSIPIVSSQRIAIPKGSIALDDLVRDLEANP